MKRNNHFILISVNNVKSIAKPLYSEYLILLNIVNYRYPFVWFHIHKCMHYATYEE